ncbi:MAG: Acetyl esterase/lipase [Chloroflexi bacterium]|nr:MAG: Acetyl esterase/lipase [Chloroflexota bacterium]
MAASIDPALFHPDAISDETAANNAKVAAEMAAAPPLHELVPQAVRQARIDGKGPQGPLVFDPDAVNRTIPGPDGEIPIRIFQPPSEPTGVYLYIHGGGWVLGAFNQEDALLAKAARRAGCVVVSVDYRLAPEDPYPAGPDDCEAAALWLTQHAQSEFGSDRLVIGGGSAGGHLAALTLLRMRDRHSFTGFRGANLMYGAFDLSETPSQSQAPQHYVIPLPAMRWFYDHYVPTQDRRDPDVSPTYAPLHDMPPALFSVGTLDPLLDDSLFMHARWLAAGNQADLAIYPGGLHGFNGTPGLKIGGDANRRVDAYLAAALAD